MDQISGTTHSRSTIFNTSIHPYFHTSVPAYFHCFFIVFCLLTSTIAFGDFRAGVSAVDITPPAGTPLGGYGARLGKPMSGVHDRIFAKALVLDDGKNRVAIVTTDLIGSDLAMQRAIADANHFKCENVMLCASHTHSGPGALANNVFAMTAMGAFDQEFYDWTRDRLIESVHKADASLVHAKIATGIRELTGCSRNRRKGGTVVDPQLTVIRVDRANGKPLACLVNFSAHGTVLGADNMLVSGDWMGAMQRALESSIGNGVVAMYANGAEGDQSPVPPSGADGFERCESLGHAVAHAAKEIYDRLKPSSRGRLRASGEEIDLPKTTKSSLLGKQKSFIQIIIITLGFSRPTSESVALIAFPGEVIAPLGLQIKERVQQLGFHTAIAMGLANDHLGYILTEDEYAIGGYEVQVSFYGERFGKQLADQIVALAARTRNTK